MTELLRHPGVLQRAQQELDAVVGRDRLVEEADIPGLKYLRHSEGDQSPAPSRPALDASRVSGVPGCCRIPNTGEVSSVRQRLRHRKGPSSVGPSLGILPGEVLVD